MKRSILAITLALIGAALLAATAAAKGPFEVEVSGGDLEAPVKLEGTVTAEALFPEKPTYIDGPVPYPANIYTLHFSEGGEDMGEISYYPAHDGIQPALRDDRGNFLAVPAELNEMLSGASLVARADVEDDSGTSMLWIAAPALLGAVVVGGGVLSVARKRS